jgi:YfiH family protein
MRSIFDASTRRQPARVSTKCDYTDNFVSPTKTSPKRKAGKPLPSRTARRPVADGWTERNSKGPCILQVSALQKVPWLVHGFSTRPGGVSDMDGEKVLNLGAVEWDSRSNVEENKRRFQFALGADDLTMVSLHQIHSDVVRTFDAAPTKQCKGDAIATKTPGLLLGVSTADCAPVLIVDPKKRVVAAIHAGWRGTLQRIVAKSIGQMQMEFGCHPQDLLAAIGPTIGGCCYEVGTEVASQFAAKFTNANEFFDELRTGDEPNPLQWLNMMPPGHQPPPKNVILNLPKANKLQLLEAGIPEKNIYITNLCTSCDVEKLFSYRKERDRSGRLLSVIGIRPAK